MRQEWEGEERFPNRERYPILLECDAHGNILWMNDRARAVLGPVENLVNVIPSGAVAASPARAGRSAELCLSKLWEGGGRILVGGFEPEAAPEMESLLRIQVNLLFHYVRLQAAEENLARARQRLRPSAPSPMRQVERERQRLGRELHTSVGQLLSAIRLQLEIVSSQAAACGPETRQALERMSTLLSEALEQVRSISRRLHPPEWQRLSLESAIRQLWDLSGVPQRFESTLRIEPLAQEPDLDAKVLIYRAAQEALSNLIRHSAASRVDAVLERRGEEIVLSVKDNGVGLDAERLFADPPNLAAGIGLRTIRDQAAALGGWLRISGNRGTHFEIGVPFQPK